MESEEKSFRGYLASYNGYRKHTRKENFINGFEQRYKNNQKVKELIKKYPYVFDDLASRFTKRNYAKFKSEPKNLELIIKNKLDEETGIKLKGWFKHD